MSQGVANGDYGDGMWLTREPQPTCHLLHVCHNLIWGMALFFFLCIGWGFVTDFVVIFGTTIYKHILHIFFEGIPRLGDLV